MAAAYLKSPDVQRTSSIAPYWCRGKASFDSPALAVAVSRRKPKDGPREPYRCSFCGKWHIGGGKVIDRSRKVHGFNLVRGEAQLAGAVRR
jgi:hypothetical protein